MHPLRVAFKANDLRNSSPTASVLMCAGHDDPTVLYLNSEPRTDDLCASADDSRYRRGMSLGFARALSPVFAVALAIVCASSVAAPASTGAPNLGALLASDDFNHGFEQWAVELEQPGSVRASDGVLDIDVPAGATLWFKQELSGPVAIVFEATAVSAGGRNDRVSDMNTLTLQMAQRRKVTNRSVTHLCPEVTRVFRGKFGELRVPSRRRQRL